MKRKANSSSPREKIRELENEIRKHQEYYYIKNKPIISDREFDRLLDELIHLEKENPQFASIDSPTRMVGSDLDSSFPKFKHTIPVLSLANTYSADEALEWAVKASGGRELLFDVQWKVDGSTLVLYYEKGKLIRAVTRGSGQIGDDVTANALTIRNIPDRLQKDVTVAVRGEAYMTFSDFQTFNDLWGSIYANPRNLTAGSLKLKKSREVRLRPIRWVAFDAFFEKDEPPDDRTLLEELRILGLPVFVDNAFVKASELKNTIHEFEKNKDSYPLPVDGLVLKIDDRSIRKEQGYTAQSPRWAVALKFEPELAETTVEDIETFVGRTGRVTPRAKLTPVHLAGTTVSYATLHNSDFIKNLDVRIGSRVKISKRGEIIPAVEEVVDRGKNKPYKFPTKCPSCKTKLFRDTDAADWVCRNPECPDRLVNGLIFYCQRKQMDISGMGEKVVKSLFEKGFIKKIRDIYTLHERQDELKQLEGLGEKSVDQMLKGIENSKEKEFRFVLPSLGLKEIGPSTTDILIENGYDSIDKIIDLASLNNAEEILNEIDGIGPRTAQYIIEQFTDRKIIEEIDALKKHGLNFSQKKDESLANFKQIFEGQSWCVTGTFEHFKPRETAMKEVKNRGGRIVSAVTSKTTHLLAGEAAGSKLKKAESLGVQIVSENEFIKELKKSSK